MAGRNLRFGLLAGACCAALGLLVPAASAQADAAPGTPFELAFWQAVAASNDPVLYEAYLKQYPAGTFAAIAQVKLDSQRKPAAPMAAPVLAMPLATPASGAGSTAVALPIPQFGKALALTAPGAANALRDAAAAQRTAEAAEAAVAAAAPPAMSPNPAPIAADSAVVTALAAPPAPTMLPTFAFGPMPDPMAGPAPGKGAQDLFGDVAAMPVGSAGLLASLTFDAARPAPAPAPSPDPAPIPLAPAAPPAMLAALGAAPAALPTADALVAAVAAQSTPVASPARLARAETSIAQPSTAAVAVMPTAPQPYYTAPRPQPQYAAAMVPLGRSRRAAMPAQFRRAVVSTAAVSVEMPDATSQISPLGIMLGQLVRTQETPGTQYGFQEEVTMPMRPRLMAMPEVPLPESFCSIEQRSAFSEGVYQPALAIAQHNAQVASAYVRRLRTLYDNYQLSGDSTSLASVAAEARDFARAANAASSIHDTLVNQFEDIMTTPIGSCGAIQ
ncbi:MAG: hypothetical protein ACKVOL_04550 [Novosphingobium sp.]